MVLPGAGQTYTRLAAPSISDSPAAVNITVDGRILGRAYLLDADGYFIAPRVPEGSTRISGVGRGAGEFQLVSTDRLSGLSLIKSVAPWAGPKTVITAPGDRVDGIVLNGFTVSADETRPVMAEVVGKVRAALLHSPNRLVPINEIRYEQVGTPANVIFFRGTELQGSLASVLVETISQTELPGTGNQISADSDNQLRKLSSNQSVKSQAQNSFGFTNSQFQSYGPGILQVGHLLGTDIVRRVVEGFRSPQRRVVYPYFGLVCRTAMSEGRGAEVVEVQPKSPADRAGLKQGDIVRQVGKFSIRNQYDYSAVVWKFKPGERVSVGFERRLIRQSCDVSINGIAY